MTLGAKKIGIWSAEDSNCPEGFAIPLKFYFDQRDLFTLISIVGVGSFFPIHNSLNQSIPHHPWLCCMRIMALNAAHWVLNVLLSHFHGGWISPSLQIRSRMGITHIRPFQIVSVVLQGETDRIPALAVWGNSLPVSTTISRLSQSW